MYINPRWKVMKVMSDYFWDKPFQGKIWKF